MYFRVKGYSSIIFSSFTNVIINNIKYYHLFCPKIRNGNLIINQKLNSKDNNIYGGWCEESRILKMYNKLPRKLKWKIEYY